jgi:hypothetical protein
MEDLLPSGKNDCAKELLEHILSSYIKTVHTENIHGWSVSLPVFDKRQPKNTQNNQRLIIYPLIPPLFDLPPFPTEFSGQRGDHSTSKECAYSVQSHRCGQKDGKTCLYYASTLL